MFYMELLNLIHSSSYKGKLLISLVKGLLKDLLVAYPVHWNKLAQGRFMQEVG